MTAMTVLIPAGLPPLFLPFGEVSGDAETETPDVGLANLADNLLEGSSSGLLDSSSALSNKLSRRRTPARPKGRIVQGPSRGLLSPASEGTPIPSEDIILSWAREVRAIYLEEEGDHLTVEALCYWVRYSFAAHTAEYRAIGDVISEGISDRTRNG